MSKRKTHEEFVNEVYELVGEEYKVVGEYRTARIKIEIKHNAIIRTMLCRVIF
jgi:hypothetical protein